MGSPGFADITKKINLITKGRDLYKIEEVWGFSVTISDIGIGLDKQKFSA